MRKNKIYYHTFGCKVNLYETQNLKLIFSKKGYESCSNFEDADICLINSCTVTSVADKKCRQFLSKIKTINPNCITIVTGCFSQICMEKQIDIKNADIITGTRNKTEIPILLEEFLQKKEKCVKILENIDKNIFEPMINKEFDDKTRAFLKIQDGCNSFCSYCIIPYARGGISSKKLDDIQLETQNFVQNNHKEIVLVGINIALYGKETPESNLTLFDAVKTVCENENVERVRLGSLEPAYLSDEIIKKLATLKKLSPHFHLSLQSGCDKTLKNMNRKYDTKTYTHVVEKLRENFPDCAITTDVIVGFPDENEEDFNKSLIFCKQIKFAKIHIFPYSNREGTKASKMQNQITKSEKHSRMKIFEKMSKECECEFLQNEVGKIVPVLFESENSPNFYHGFTPNYTLVKIFKKNLKKSLKKEIIYVKIIGYDSEGCIGEFIN